MFTICRKSHKVALNKQGKPVSSYCWDASWEVIDSSCVILARGSNFQRTTTPDDPRNITAGASIKCIFIYVVLLSLLLLLSSSSIFGLNCLNFKLHKYVCTNQTCRTLLEKQGWAHKGCSPMTKQKQDD